MKSLLFACMLFIGFIIYAFPPSYAISPDSMLTQPPSTAKNRIVRYYGVDYSFGKMVTTMNYGEVYEYDSKGLLISRYTFDPSDQSSQLHIYKYDDKRRLIEEGLKYSDDEYYKLKEIEIGMASSTETLYSIRGLWQKTVRKYDSDGREIELTEYDKDGVINYMFSTEYRPDMKIERSYSASGDLTSVSKYYLDKHGRIIKREDYYKDKMTLTMVYTFDAIGNEIAWQSIDENGRIKGKGFATFSNGLKTSSGSINISTGAEKNDTYEYSDGEITEIRHYESQIEAGDKIMKLKYIITASYE